MTKILSLLVFVLSFSVQGQSKCSFTRHHYVEIEGKDVSKVLRHKLLNDFNPDKVIVQKINEELGMKICGTFRPFHNLKDIPVVPAPKEERLLTKVILTPNKTGFWEMSVENLIRKNEKEMTSVTAVEKYTSPKSIKDIKDSEVVEWVSSKLLVLTNK